ncbi:CsiV family protein [Legionella saoudiensis]|uniref:CsiV family protein n=1 Tax=Legionella saoudiensis TaxID=1750561 RepID=UPI000731124A|nr:CsiV family protein [Legionella saoudiensis]
MQRLLIITIALLYSCFSFAKPNYQIDLIVFAQQPLAAQSSGSSLDSPIIPMTHSNAISLKPSAAKTPKPYCLLSNSYSSLKDQYYLLSRRSPHPVLGHYSWRQPANSQSTVALPLAEHNGWQMQGTLRITQGNYYNFDAHLQVSPPSNPYASFTISQKQRLKGNTVYYLDNDHLGMIVKIHQVS